MSDKLLRMSETNKKSQTKRKQVRQQSKDNLYNNWFCKLLKPTELRTGGSVGWASGCHVGGREFDSGRTNTQGLKITEEKLLPL